MLQLTFSSDLSFCFCSICFKCSLLGGQISFVCLACNVKIWRACRRGVVADAKRKDSSILQKVQSVNKVVRCASRRDSNLLCGGIETTKPIFKRTQQGGETQLFALVTQHQTWNTFHRNEIQKLESRVALRFAVLRWLLCNPFYIPKALAGRPAKNTLLLLFSWRLRALGGTDEHQGSCWSQTSLGVEWSHLLLLLGIFYKDGILSIGVCDDKEEHSWNMGWLRKAATEWK